MYQLTPNPDIIIRLDDNANIPANPDNRDYVEYQAWVASGNTPDPAPEPAPPTMISALDFWNRLDDAAKLAIAADPALNVFIITALARGSIDLADPLTRTGMDAAIAGKAITADQAEAILSP